MGNSCHIIKKTKGEIALNEVIWKYMSLAKFVDLLKTKELFFCRADLFEDKFEGASPIADFYLRQQVLEQIRTLSVGSETLKVSDGKQWIEVGKGEDLNFIFEEARTMHFINCWHKNKEESEAMWKLYLQGNEGVAIQSTVNDLIDSIDKTDKYVMFDNVEYINYESMNIPQFLTNKYQWTAQYFIKRNHYSHEKEYRAVIRKIDFNKVKEKEGVVYDKDKQIENKGLKVDVDLQTLIKGVYVSPMSAPYFREIVDDLIEKYCLKDGQNNLLLSKPSMLNTIPYY